MSDPTNDTLDPQAAQFVSRVRRMMLISGLTTLVAIAAVLGAIGYRVYRSGESQGSVGAAAEITALLPKGARIVATAVADERIVVTVDVGGATELHVFDAKTLRRVGRLKFATEP
jgi:hypothetical protein